MKERKPSGINTGILIVLFAALLLCAAVYMVSQSILFTPRLSASQPIGGVRMGMPKYEVIELLGEPHHIEMKGTPNELWAYYPNDGMLVSWLDPYYISFDLQGKVEDVY